MNVLVAYESRSGRTRRAAEAVAAAVRARGSDAILKTLAETAAEDIEHADAVAIGTWVEGFIVAKVGPAKAALEAIGQLPAIGGKPVAVFCTYGVTPRTTLATLRRSLEAKGANVVAENASHRTHPDRGAAELAQRLCTAPEAT